MKHILVLGVLLAAVSTANANFVADFKEPSKNQAVSAGKAILAAAVGIYGAWAVWEMAKPDAELWNQVRHFNDPGTDKLARVNRIAKLLVASGATAYAVYFALFECLVPNAKAAIK